MRNPVDKSGDITIAQNGTKDVGVAEGTLYHTLTVKAGTATAGTIAITFTPVDGAAPETLNDEYGAAISQNLATTTQKTYSLSRPILLQKFTCTMSGGNGTALVSLVSS
jgi:hypothetical protein